MDFPILFEDDYLLVINKPYGVIVNRAQTVKTPTVQDWMDSKFLIHNFQFSNEVEKAFVERSGVVHRLDKETSGCLILAKRAATFAKLQAFFKERLVEKKYIALVHGKLQPGRGDITAPIGRLPWNRERFGVVPGGKEAQTQYQVTALYQDETHTPFTLVLLLPKTGRTHQLRVHLKYLGFPIVGDYLYAGRKQQVKDRVWCPRVFLHASEISFSHPETGVRISIKSPLPDELTAVLSQLTLLN